MTDPEVQLSFDVGGAVPQSASLRIGGSAGLSRELRKGEEVYVRVMDADGGVLSDGYAWVVGVEFRDKRDAHGNLTSTERRHTVQLR